MGMSYRVAITFCPENVVLSDGQLAGSAVCLGFDLKPVSPHFSKQEAGCQCPRRASKPAVQVYGLESWFINYNNFL